MAYGRWVEHRLRFAPPASVRPVILAGLAWLAGCASPSSDAPSPGPTTSTATTTADIVSVSVSGQANAYTFAVGIRSPDTGCDRYSDWWEVVTDDGQLAYRRILAHSHVDEQPFVRSGGPLDLAPTDVVWVRAHMNTGGYGVAMRGTPGTTFEIETPEDEAFAEDLENADPQPSGCAF